MLTDRAADVLAFVRERGVTHPRDVQAHLGHEPVINDWGGKSSATTLELERLQHYGFLRVARTLAPVSEASLSPAVSLMVPWLRAPRGRPGGRPVIRDLLARGELASADVAGTRYVWPADLVPVEADRPGRVRFPGAV